MIIKNSLLRKAFIIPLLCFSFSLSAQSVFSHIKELKEDQTSPPASIEEVSWITGNWRGNAIGGKTEEIWSEPMAGTMMGSFRLIVNDEVKFYELCIVREVGQTLLLQIKHFNSDLAGWEEKDESETFPLVEINENAVYFDGLTFEKVSDDEMNIYVLFDSQGKQEEAKFPYKRIIKK